MAAALLLALAGGILLLGFGCAPQAKKNLVVYAGKGLKPALDEAKGVFEQRHNISLSVVYAGSDNLLATIQKTRTGDIFIPGATPYLHRAGNLLAEDRKIADHLPAFAVRVGGAKPITTFADLLAPGVAIAVGNKDMCAIGQLAEEIISASEQQAALRNNIVITASTVNELLKLVVAGEVDAALVWADMLQWPEATGLQRVDIPAAINRPEEIRAAVMASSASPKEAAKFLDFLAGEGRAIFVKHGFGAQ